MEAALSGRKFEEDELQAGGAVCIVGETVRREIYGGIRGLGEQPRVNRSSCDVIGVLLSRVHRTGRRHGHAVPVRCSDNVLSLFLSAGIGLLVGYFPARRAARTDPIEALCHE